MSLFYSELLKIKLPKKYKEGLIKYELGFDNVPNWIELSEKGYTWNEHMKLNQLVAIEYIKYTLKEAIEDKEVTEEEIKEAKKLIDKAIEEYNAM